jgi:hypothetical protein
MRICCEIVSEFWLSQILLIQKSCWVLGVIWWVCGGFEVDFGQSPSVIMCGSQGDTSGDKERVTVLLD